MDEECIVSLLKTEEGPHGGDLAWISVEEESIPGEEGSDPPVLIYMPCLDQDPDFPGLSIMVSNPVYAKRQASLGTVTHWMPLPEPPKETT